MSARPHFLAPLLAAPHARHVLRCSPSGRVAATIVEGAFDSKSRTRGLLGRAGLAPEAVLIIAPCNSVHTFFMKFAIDVVFTNRDGMVLKVCRRLGPWRIAWAFRAFATLEFAAGAADRSGITAGTRLVIESDSTAAPPPSSDTPRG